VALASIRIMVSRARQGWKCEDMEHGMPYQHFHDRLEAISFSFLRNTIPICCSANTDHTAYLSVTFNSECARNRLSVGLR